MSTPIDLNSDLGEGFGVWRLGDDDALLGVVSSANVACGFHAGDPPTLRAVTTRAAAEGVAVGAQVSYPGPRRLRTPPHGHGPQRAHRRRALPDRCPGRVLSGRRYPRPLRQTPRCPLQRDTVEDPMQAAAVVRAVQEYDPTLPVLGLPGSELLRHADAAGLAGVPEGFADRNYTPQGHLVARSRPEALITDEDTVVARAVQMAQTGAVVAVDGTVLRLPVRSLCVHGDTPGAASLARRVRAALESVGLPPTPFAS